MQPQLASEAWLEAFGSLDDLDHPQASKVRVKLGLLDTGSHPNMTGARLW